MEQPAELKIPFAKAVIRCAVNTESGGWKWLSKNWSIKLGPWNHSS